MFLNAVIPEKERELLLTEEAAQEGIEVLDIVSKEDVSEDELLTDKD